MDLRRSWGQSAKDGDLLSNIGTLFFSKCNKGLSSALRMSYQSQLAEASLTQYPTNASGQIHDTHLPDVPAPESWIAVRQRSVFGLETTSIVTKPVIESRLGQIERKGIVVVAAIGARGVQQTVYHQNWE